MGGIKKKLGIVAFAVPIKSYREDLQAVTKKGSAIIFSYLNQIEKKLTKTWPPV